MFLNRKVSGGTLILTIVIASILAILCTALILLGYYNRHNQSVADMEQRLMVNLQSAVNIVLADTVSASPVPRDTFDLFNDQKDSVIITKENWGLFRAAAVTAFGNQFSKHKAFISGPALPDYMDGCLYLADHQRPLSISGSTRLTGDAYLSKAGIKAAYIDQRGYDHDRLLEGTIKISQQNLPALDTQLIAGLYALTGKSTLPYLQPVMTAGDSLIQSFYDSVLVYVSPGALILDGWNLKGHIIIKSDSVIEAGENTLLEDVILVAPVIKFRKAFKGTVQAIATDSLLVEPGCVFDYPSSLVLLKSDSMTIQNVLRIGNDCTVHGIITTSCNAKDIYKTYVEIGKNTTINGIVYVMGYLALNGQVRGTVLSDYFIYRTPAVVYENYLVDVAINRKQLSAWFTGSPFFAQSKTWQVIKWVP